MNKFLLACALAAISALNLRAADSALEELGDAVTPFAAEALVPPAASAPVRHELAPEKAGIPEKYAYLDPRRLVPANLLAAALEYYDGNLPKIGNTAYLSVVDFSKFSGLPRFFIIEMKTGSVRALRVAHGEGSDPGDTGYAAIFSNTPASKQSSLGFYSTGELYSGAYGRSMRLDGLSPTNSNARSRNIVVHGYAGVVETGAQIGLSQGCLAVGLPQIGEVIASLKGGSIIYAGLSAAD
ncbi:MAG: murein L,D-transpeptidase catalytic domain-containing protein [Elusimicrobiota bacterium]